MTRVLMDGSAFGITGHGGITLCFKEWLTRIPAIDHDIRFMVSLPPQLMVRPPSGDGIEILHAWVNGRISRPLQQWTHNRRIKNFSPAIYHATYYSMCKFPGTKSVVSVYDFIDRNTFEGMSGNSMAFVDQQRVAIERADAVVAISDATKTDILKYTNVLPEKVSVVHLGVSDEFMGPEPTTEQMQVFARTWQIDRSYWLFVGGRLHYKNFSTLLRAWASSIEGGGDSLLVAISPRFGLEPWQIDFIIRNRLESRLRLIQMADITTLRCAYRGAAAFVYPSICEGFGIPLLEAMACRCPVIASDIPAFREVAADAALFFDPHDSGALLDAMDQVQRGDVCSMLSKRGLERVQQFSWNKSARNLINVYKKLDP